MTVKSVRLNLVQSCESERNVRGEKLKHIVAFPFQKSSAFTALKMIYSTFHFRSQVDAIACLEMELQLFQKVSTWDQL